MDDSGGFALGLVPATLGAPLAPPRHLRPRMTRDTTAQATAARKLGYWQPQVPPTVVSGAQHMALSVGWQQLSCSAVEQHDAATALPISAVAVATVVPAVGLLARTIAEIAAACTRWVSVMLMSVSPAA